MSARQGIRSRRALLTVAVGLLLLPIAAFSNDELLKLQKDPGQWVMQRKNYAATGYSELAQINTDNVKELGLSWAFDVGPGGGAQEATPIVSNGVIYGITNWSIVFAVDARTGKEKWRWDPWVERERVRPEVCCGIVNRGVALYKGLVIAPIIDGRLQALDAETGKVVWESRIAYPQDHYSVTMAPRRNTARKSQTTPKCQTYDELCMSPGAKAGGQPLAVAPHIIV